jgi:sugar-specific transcriptional regulator TrmB
MKVAEILEFLQKIGLNEYEARVYSTLSVAGHLKAGNISKESGVPQSKVYWVLDDLIEKQLVEVAEGKPKEYKAVRPEIALKRLLEEKEKSINSMKSGLKEVSGFLQPIKTGEAMSGVWTIHGRNWVEFFNKACEMIERGKKYVYGVTRDYSRSAKLSEIVEAASRRGVKVRVIGMQRINEENYLKAKWYVEHGVELRILESNLHPRIVLVDGKEVLLRLDHEHTRKEGFPFSSIWSEDPSLVKVFDTYVKNLWEEAKEVDFRKVETIESI